jgi:hypothetical protein
VALDRLFARTGLRGAAFILACACGTALTTQPKVASAQDAYHCIEELSDDEVAYRVQYIEDSFKKGKKHATAWRYAWLGVLAATAGVESWLAVDAGKDEPWDRFAFAYLAAGSGLTALVHAAVPAPDVWGAKRIARMDSDTPEARRAQLEYATKTMDKAAMYQDLMGGALGVGAGVAYGIAGGTAKAVKWTGHTPGITALTFLQPPVLMGLRAATAPRQQIEGWENYRGIACSSKYYDKSREDPELDCSVGPTGASFSIQF